eukprot:s42_g24.t1
MPLESGLSLAGRITRPAVVQRPYAPSAPVFWTPAGVGVPTGGASSSRDVPPTGARFAGAAAAALGVHSRRIAARRSVRRAKAADEELDMDFGEESNDWDEEALPLAEDEDWDEEGTAMRFAEEEDEDTYDEDWDEEAGSQEGTPCFPKDGDMYDDEEDWDEGYSMPFSEEDDPGRSSEGSFVGSVFDGMDALDRNGGPG